MGPKSDRTLAAPTTLVAPVSSVAPQRRAVLTVVRGGDVGRVMRLAGALSFTLGRRATCSYGVEDPAVSGMHARIVAAGEDYYIADDGSTNGTFVNGVRVEAEPVKLADGDRIMLGPTVLLRFAFVDPAEEEALQRIYDATLRDALTGVFNRKHLDERLDAEIAYARRHATALSVVMLDVDHFKQVNDTHGHRTGDAVLKAVADTLVHGLRTEDVVARYGGEEFVVIARATRLPEATLLAERLRELMAHVAVGDPSHALRVTLSAGVASLECCGETRTTAALLSIADRRLYRAKDAGRNRVVAEG
jgi:two-component system cell cycle response regulator